MTRLLRQKRLALRSWLNAHGIAGGSSIRLGLWTATVACILTWGALAAFAQNTQKSAPAKPVPAKTAPVKAAPVKPATPAPDAAPIMPPGMPTPSAQSAAAKAAAEAKANIDVTDGWTRATPGNATAAAVYFRVTNVGKLPDKLTAAKTENSNAADLHSTTTANGVASMGAMGPLIVAPSGNVTFAPGGRHVMLTGLKAPLREGESFFMKLTFEKAGDQTLVVRVLGAAATGLPGPPKPANGDMISGATQR